MFRQTVFTIGACILLMASVQAQDARALLVKAHATYDQGKYAESAGFFAQAIAAGTTGYRVRYDAACSFALSGFKDSAFYYLNQSMESGYYNVDHMQQDLDLRTLRADSRWTACVEKAKLNKPQTILVAKTAKTIDTTHQSVVAILAVDSAGKAFVTGSGVLIHPKVVLTAGHVNAHNVFGDDRPTEGLVSLSNNALDPGNRYSFDWLKDVESHPDTAAYAHVPYDTTHQTNPYMFIDVGLIFLRQAVVNRPVAQLPDSNALARSNAHDLLEGVGYGFDKVPDSHFTLDLVDGIRRHWRLQNISLMNDLWLSTECDSVTNLPFTSIFDSGAPLFLNNNMVVGIWSLHAGAIEPCPYSSRAVRIDNPKVLAWIKDRIKKRLGVDLK
jgi:V8-like Glu-specific endopeptidase